MQSHRDSDSSGELIPIHPLRAEAKQRRNSHGYSEEFQAMLERLDQEDACEEASVTAEKKRRLSLDQVKALERNFELENKLEPGRKLKLAQELGLQPRQIAIWFQNRRARYKTKLLERDYGLLKANYDALKLSYVNLEHERETLSLQLRELKEKMREGLEGRKDMVKQSPVSNADNSKSSEYNIKNHNVAGDNLKVTGKLHVKEEGNVNSPPSSVSCSNTVMNCFQLSDSINVLGKSYYQPQVVRMEDQSLFCIDESCSFFAVDQAPTLQWSFQDE